MFESGIPLLKHLGRHWPRYDRWEPYLWEQPTVTLVKYCGTQSSLVEGNPMVSNVVQNLTGCLSFISGWARTSVIIPTLLKLVMQQDSWQPPCESVSLHTRRWLVKSQGSVYTGRRYAKAWSTSSHTRPTWKRWLRYDMQLKLWIQPNFHMPFRKLIRT